MKTLAIGNGGRVDLWCEGTPARFDVINGAWSGSLKNGILTVSAFETTYPAQLLWVGEVPREHLDYNDAISWIQNVVDNERTTS